MPNAGHRVVDARSGVETVPVETGHYARQMFRQLAARLQRYRVEAKRGTWRRRNVEYENGIHQSVGGLGRLSIDHM